MPPPAYGGTELVVHLVTEELVRRGHEVTLFATGDSQTSARLETVVPRPFRYGDPAGMRHPEHVHLANAQACFRAAAEGRFDIVHNHAGLEGMALAAASTTAVLTTSHAAYAPETAPIWETYPWYHNAVSAASARTFPVRGALAPVHHGIDVAAVPFSERGDGYLVFLGRMAPEKGPAAAIEAARRAGRPLVIAGKIDTSDRPHFEAAVEPLIDGGDVRFIGEVDPASKARLLGGADALLFPIDWDEPFGLVMIEALASGTPVVAFRRASVPEIIEDGRTGFIVDDVDAMVEAIGRIGSLSRAECRRIAETRFSVALMAEAYELRYAEAIARGPVVGTTGLAPVATA